VDSWLISAVQAAYRCLPSFFEQCFRIFLAVVESHEAVTHFQCHPMLAWENVSSFVLSNKNKNTPFCIVLATGQLSENGPHLPCAFSHFFVCFFFFFFGGVLFHDASQTFDHTFNASAIVEMQNFSSVCEENIFSCVSKNFVVNH
jgi:hypothetical protein